MLIEHSSDLIRHIESQTLSNGVVVTEASLINDNALVISQDAIALYRRPGDCTHPLGKGFIRSEALPEDLFPEGCPEILTHKAGFAGLTGGVALLIGLNDVRVFLSPQDALKNANEICRMSLADDGTH
ncbi:MAG: hypothetical protein VXZ05_00505 [Pseudomonadota bacterium]|nr:hypothetical protein [Pseudomonadota bacterium]